MPQKITLKVGKRSITGKKVKQLRRKGILPANIYGKDIKSLAVEMLAKDFLIVYKQAGETSIIDVTVDKEKNSRPVLIGDIHQHPVTDDYLHVDFHQVDLTKKVTVSIPLELTGEAPAVNKGGVLIQLMDEIEVEALPTDLPDKFEVNVAKLEEIGQSISLKTLKLSDKVKFLTENLHELIVKIEEPAKEEKPAEVAPEATEEQEEKPASAEEGSKEDKKEEEKPAEAASEDKPTEEKK